MKAIMVMYDSLCRHMLEPYGCDWTHTPNFRRLAERTVMFDRAYVGSMPCMPARREIHTGRLNFLHRSWGPIEPFDDSMPEILKHNGVYTHLVSDHYHYWEEGGCNYHTRYSSWEIERGQEGDPWKGEVNNPDAPETVNAKKLSQGRQDWINRKYMPTPEKQSQPLTFDRGLEFLRTNHAEDKWFLHLETFDPHEPYFTHQKYKDLYKHDYQGRHFDWPNYAPVTETVEEINHVRMEYAALHSMCDEQLGRILDLMDELDLWKDTMLIVNTDHGFLLGEHGWCGKCAMPFYNEIANTPLFIWDPRCGKRGERRGSFVQTIDLPPTLLEYFGVPLPKDMQGSPLRDTIDHDAPAREAGLYGMHGCHVNVTDGRYVYMRAPRDTGNQPLNEYTLMPAHMRHTFQVAELQDIRMREPFEFTKNCRVMQIQTPASRYAKAPRFASLLFDLESDPGQEHPIQNAAVEARMTELLIRLMRENDAPAEQYERLSLTV